MLYKNILAIRLNFPKNKDRSSFLFLITPIIFLFYLIPSLAVADDTTPPSASFSYTSTTSKVGTNKISVEFSEPITNAPTININQPGSVDISNADMSNIGGSIWTKRSLGAYYLKSVTYGNGTFVAVGSTANSVQTSSDGITWTTRTAAENNTWTSVTYGNNLFVAVAETGTNRVMTSPDGITWTIRTGVEANLWKSVTYGNNTFVAVATTGTNKVMTSSDGITWTPRVASWDASWNSVTYGNNTFVAVSSSSKTMTSPDGITWTTRTAAWDTSWNSVTHGNNTFVAVSGGGLYRVMTSSDGINWIARTAAEANSWKSVTYGKGLFVAIANSGTNKIMTSVDGITWIAKSIPSSTNDWSGLTYGNGLFVAVGQGEYSAITSSAFYYSYDYIVNQSSSGTYIDGVTNVSVSENTDLAGNVLINRTSSFVIDTASPTVNFTYSKNPTGVGVNKITAFYSESIQSAPLVSVNQPGTSDVSNQQMTDPGNTWTARAAAESNAWKSVAYGNGVFVAVSNSGTNRVMMSTDGTTWLPVVSNVVSSKNLRAVTFGNGLFVATVDYTNKILTSPDGINWTERVVPDSLRLDAITYGNGLFVALSTNNTPDNRSLISSDGINWSSQTGPGPNKNWASVAYGNGLFVAVSGSTGSDCIMRSSDGINWYSNIISDETQNWSSVAYGNGLFVVLSNGFNGKFITSLDGVNWTIRTGASGYWKSLTFGNNLFVAVATSGTNKVMISFDGITWTTKIAAESNQWNSVTYGNGLFVAVSETGINKVMTSPGSYSYNYTVNKNDGSSYIDGTAIATLTSVTDMAGNISNNPTNNTFTIDTTGPTVSLSYSKGVSAGVGVNTITATYSKAVTSAPNISINQPGNTDISLQPMTGSGTVWTYDYTVNIADGAAYIDGAATVSLSSVADSVGNTADAPTNTTFTIDTVAPTAEITYSINHAVKSGDSQIITATFSEPMADNPIPQIAITGSNTLVLTNMTKVDTTHYTYTHIVGSGNGVATITLGNGTDVAINTIMTNPISGATFTIDNILPTGNITPICSITGNGCTVLGSNANPQEPYKVGTLSGTSTDPDSLGVETIEVSIKDVDINKWYNGTSFVDESETYLAGVGTANWSFDFSEILLTINHTYNLNIKISDTALNSQIIPLSFKFTNAPPVVSNVMASQVESGLVTVSYDVTDIESSQTTNSLFFGINTTLDGTITNESSSIKVSDAIYLSESGVVMIDEEIISYSSKVGNTLSGLSRGYMNTFPVSHTSGASIYKYAASATGTGIGLSNKGTEKVVSWLARTDANGYESANGIIRVVANDGSTGSMIGFLDSNPFYLDARKPSTNITFDAGVAGLTDSATIFIPDFTDLSTVEYRIMDDSNSQTNVVDTDWITFTGSTTIPWTFDSDIEVKTLKYKFRDSYGNETEDFLLETHTPIPSSSFMVQDTSNVSANPPYYDVYIGWQTTDSSDFSSYKLEQANSSDNINYGEYSDIISSSLSDPATNYYIARNLNSNLYYKYRLGVVDTNGNVSVRSNPSITTKPDGVQNYGEGGGGSVATAPKVENVTVTQSDDDKKVTVNYKLTDSSSTKKVNPSYESYLFYNIGITLPTNSLSGNTIKVSDTSRLKSSGYILINNEVVNYTGKSDETNTLTGVTRGTWPTIASTGRATRTNPSLLAGTPVWIMASGTSPFEITNNTIPTGQYNTLLWDTYQESYLAGSTYSNVDIKVLIHDKQDVLSGPLSNQNDFSENGILNTLDLEDPIISFAESGSSGVENVSLVALNLNLARSYPKNSSIQYTVTGTATNTIDYTLASGLITITAGETSATIELPIIDDTLKEENETITVTLSDPIGAILGTNLIYTYTITDDDNQSGVEFSLTSVTNTENVTSVKVPVVLAEISGTNVVLNYVVSGTASSEDDFSLSDGEITILAGETTADINLSIIDDTLKEDNETIIITITNATGATLGSNKIYTYTIVDNDTYPTLSFGSLTSQRKEDANTENILVSLSSSYPEDITFNYSITGGSAEGNSVDYLLEETSGTIAAGTTNTNIPIIIFDDDLSEETENIIITLSSPVNAILGSDVVHAFSILDNEIMITDINGASVKSTSARIVWTTADYTDSLIEYDIVNPGTEGLYSFAKSSLEKVLNHNVYLDNLTPETKYYFKTTSVNLAEEVTVSRSEFTTTPGPVISNVSSGNTTDTSTTISWMTDIPSTSYVTYSTDSKLSASVTYGASDFVTEHSVIISDLSSGSNYYYLVTSADDQNNVGENADGGSYYNFTTNGDETAPVISEVSVPIRTNNQVAIVWTTNEPANGKIRYGTSQGEYNNSTELIYSLVTNHLTAISELEESTQYYYVIESTDENGNKTISDEYSFETTATEKVVITKGGGGISGVAQELYDIILAENQAYKAKYSSLSTDAPIISNIEISNITAFNANISFQTDKDTVAFVNYGKDKDYGQITADDGWSTGHNIKLSGLSLGTEYNFKISAMDKSNNTGYSDNQVFTTRYLSEDISELQKIDNVEQFQAEIESTIESILPSLAPPFIGKPEVSNITENSATISFKTNIKSYPIVSYAPDSSYNSSKQNPYDGETSDSSEKTIIHEINLMGLKSNTLYHYMVKAFSLPQVIGKSEDLTFTTAASKIQASVIDVKKDSFTVVWYTDEPSSSIVEYKNMQTGRISRIVDDNKNTSHSIKIENLVPGTVYELQVSGINNKGNIIESGSTITIKTSTDNTPPTITNLKVDSALVTGRTDRVQTIISWQTDEPATSSVYYQEGSGSIEDQLSNKQEDGELTKNHVVILTILKPGTIYRFTVSSTDDAGNTVKPPVRTIITPKKTESIVDVIFKNFDDTFNFINNVR